MSEPIIVETDVAVAFLKREGVTDAAARKWIYRASAAGHIRNHGKPGKGRARWDLREIEKLVWPNRLPSGR